MTDEMQAPGDQLALVQILDALRGLQPIDRDRVLAAVAVFCARRPVCSATCEVTPAGT